MKIICTTCTKKKDASEGLLPAKKRYLGDPITKVSTIAKEQDSDFFIFSGKYGLLQSDEPIPYYDYLLIEKDVDALVIKVIEQLKELDATEITLYSEGNPNWKPYEDTLSKAAEALAIPITIQKLT